ncbi:MAG: hypothetical protein Q4G69_13040, partial [Planctomycetia bacterium]|nr:hypothetical protein [Planctomycetia bacterium]
QMNNQVPMNSQAPVNAASTPFPTAGSVPYPAANQIPAPAAQNTVYPNSYPANNVQQNNSSIPIQSGSWSNQNAFTPGSIGGGY